MLKTTLKVKKKITKKNKGRQIPAKGHPLKTAKILKKFSGFLPQNSGFWTPSSGFSAESSGNPADYEYA